MRLIDLPLVVRDDISSLGIEPSQVVDADADGATIRFTHDQLTALADRRQVDDMKFDVDDFDGEAYAEGFEDAVNECRDALDSVYPTKRVRRKGAAK